MQSSKKTARAQIALGVGKCAILRCALAPLHPPSCLRVIDNLDRQRPILMWSNTTDDAHIPPRVEDMR